MIPTEKPTCFCRTQQVQTVEVRHEYEKTVEKLSKKEKKFPPLPYNSITDYDTMMYLEKW